MSEETSIRPGLPTVEVVIVASVLLVIVMWFQWRHDRLAVNPGHSASCKNNLKQIGLALHNYHDAYGCFPPAYVADADGRPMHSWRVLILPFMEEQELYDRYRFDEPWDGPNNRWLHSEKPVFLSHSGRIYAHHIYQCPGASDMEADYLAVVGPHLAWPGACCTTYADFSDGRSQTIQLIEVQDSGIHWMEPRDLDIASIKGLQDLGVPPMHTPIPRQPRNPKYYPGFHALRADGGVNTFAPDVDAALFRALLTRDGNEPLEPPWW